MEEECDSTIVIDIEELQNSLKINLDHRSVILCNSSAERRASICIVQELLRDVYKSDYEPVVVSIGPYYHGNQKLQDMEKVKWKSLEYILRANHEKNLHDYIEELWELYPTAISYYPEDIKMQGKEFVHVSLLDGLFVVAFVCGLGESSNNPNPLSVNENLDRRMDPLEDSLVIRDFLLIENQIPFIIVKRMYELFSCKDSMLASLLENFTKFFEQIFPGNLKPIEELERPREIYNMLHLCHMYLRPNLNGDCYDRELKYDCPVLNQWHQAIDYHFAGVKFEKKESDKNNPHSLLDVSFIGDILQIPYIFVDENTAAILRNLVALEQANPHIGNHISTYIFFISQLVSTTEDVALLVNQEIISHHFESDEEVSNIFTSLGDCVVFDFACSYYLKNICQNLEAYYESRMKWGVGWLRRANSAFQLWI